MRRAWQSLIAAALFAYAGEASAAGYSDYGADLEAPASVFALEASFRLRGALFYNLDLDRGPTPSGELLFPVPLGGGQAITFADMRARSDLTLYAPFAAMALKSRIDFFDNVALGSMTDGIPAASSSQRADEAYIRIRRLYAEVLTPFGLLSAGRSGHDFGLGMVANGGDCEECDYGDSADRIAFVMPLAHHLWAVSYDFSATGPFLPARGETRVIDFAPSAQVHTLSAAILNYRGPKARARRSRAAKVTPEYGLLGSYRFQEDDVPASYLPTAQPVALSDGQLMSRGYEAGLLDLWLRFEGANFRVETEAAYLHASVEQASLIPGVLYRTPVTSNQIGAALQTEFGDADGTFRLGVDAGIASGDAAPGFGAFPKLGQPVPQPGDLDGAQANPPFDTEVNNFRFHPDFHIDRILFREIIGAVTDAVYIKPHARLDLASFRRGRLELQVASVLSFAMNSGSTPGGEAPLGIEIDPSLGYEADGGFSAFVDYGVLFPFGGLDNSVLGLEAQIAQTVRARLRYGFQL